MTQYGRQYGHHWCLWKDHEKCRSPMKMELKKLQQLKSYGQIKIFTEIRAIFPCILIQNFNELEGPLWMLRFVSIFFGSSSVATECDKIVAEIIHTTFVFMRHPPLLIYLWALIAWAHQIPSYFTLYSQSEERGGNEQVLS